MHHFIKLLAWIFVALCALSIAAARPGWTRSHGADSPMPSTESEARWFARMKPYCNSVEAVTRMHADPPPASTLGLGYGAACHALAGRIDSARMMILRAEPNERFRAASVVFDVGHPVADMGDDRSAGPMMELVVEFWPNHYMALYHAGASEYQLGQFGKARANLDSFMHVYDSDDGWRQSARSMLAEINGGKTPRTLEVIP